MNFYNNNKHNSRSSRAHSSFGEFKFDFHLDLANRFASGTGFLGVLTTLRMIMNFVVRLFRNTAAQQLPGGGSNVGLMGLMNEAYFPEAKQLGPYLE